MKKAKLWKEVVRIFIDDNMGIVFKTLDDKRYGYKYFQDASGAICDIQIVPIPDKKKVGR